MADAPAERCCEHDEAMHYPLKGGCAGFQCPCKRPPPAERTERMGDEEFERIGSMSWAISPVIGLGSSADLRALYAEGRRAREAEAALLRDIGIDAIEERAANERLRADLAREKEAHTRTVATASKLLAIAVCDGCLLGEGGRHLHLSEEDNDQLAHVESTEAKLRADLAAAQESVQEARTLLHDLRVPLPEGKRDV